MSGLGLVWTAAKAATEGRDEEIYGYSAGKLYSYWYGLFLDSA
jgi:hypothetical protein